MGYWQRFKAVFSGWFPRLARGGWRRFLPLLHLEIEIPFIALRADIMHEDFSWRRRTFIGLFGRVFKWRVEVALYDTYRRVEEREHPLSF